MNNRISKNYSRDRDRDRDRDRNMDRNRNKRTLGLLGENYAVNYLRNHNISILDRNFRFSRFGEIDIIASENEYICFIEVKTRTSNFFGMPSESVNINKQKKIKMLAQIYLKGKGLLGKNIRFDIIEVFVEYTNANTTNNANTTINTTTNINNTKASFNNHGNNTHMNTGMNTDAEMGNDVKVKKINHIRNAF